MAPPIPGGQRPAFVGEGVCCGELQFLSESEKRAVIYFTQSAGELVLDPPPGGEIAAGASASRLKGVFGADTRRCGLSGVDVSRRYLGCHGGRGGGADFAAPAGSGGSHSPLHDRAHAPTRRRKLIVLAGAQFDPKGRSSAPSRRAPSGVLRPSRLTGWLVVASRRSGLADADRRVHGTRRAGPNPVAMALGQKPAFMTRSGGQWLRFATAGRR